MRKYEALFILKPDVSEKVEIVIKQINDEIKKNNGTVLSADNWGKKTPAYPIKKHQEAVYYKLNFSCQPDAIDKMDKMFKLNDNILRTLVFKEK